MFIPLECGLASQGSRSYDFRRAAIVNTTIAACPSAIARGSIHFSGFIESRSRFSGCLSRRGARSPYTGQSGDGPASPVFIWKEPPDQHMFSQDGSWQHGGMLSLNRRAVTLGKSMGPRERAKMSSSPMSQVRARGGGQRENANQNSGYRGEQEEV